MAEPLETSERAPSPTRPEQQVGVTATQALLRSVDDLLAGGIPTEVMQAARQCLLDFIGVAIAGAREPLVDILVSEVVAPEGGGTATLIGRSERASRLDAALLNGAAGHALDFDDTHTTMSGHPTVPVLPALLALAEAEGGSLQSVLEALVAGIELESRVSLLLGPKHYGVGFHSTGTIGTFGAAYGCARLLGLQGAAIGHALGLAGTQAAGLKSSFGTMAKPLHAGRAAAAGLLSALLARGGFVANPGILHQPQGFAATHAGDLDPERLERAHGRFLIRETLFKYHAACYLTHAAIEAAAQLRPTLESSEIERVVVQVAPSLFDVCNIAQPSTGLEGKFSLRYTVALSLLGEDTGSLSAYTDQMTAREDVVALRDRVQVEPVKSYRATQARLEVVTTSGSQAGEADTGNPASDLNAQGKKLSKKFESLVSPLFGEQAAEEIRDLVLSESMASASSLLALCRKTT